MERGVPSHGKECPFPSLLGSLGEHPMGSDRSRGRKRVLLHLEFERTHLMAINFAFLPRIFSHIHILFNIKLLCMTIFVQKINTIIAGYAGPVYSCAN